MRAFTERIKLVASLLVFGGAMAWVIIGHFGWLAMAGATSDKGALAASLDKTTVKLGDTVWLSLRYRLPDGAALQTPPKIGGIKGLEIIDQAVDPGRIRIKLFVDRLKSWQSDPLTLSFTDKDGVLQTLTADPVSLTVSSVLGEKPAEARLRPIQDIIPTTGFWRSYWLLTSILAGLVLALTGAYLWYRIRRNRNVKIEVIEPPHLIAKKALEALEKRRIFEKGQVKAFYFIFSEILRRYLESIRNFPAVEYTTEEIARHMHSDNDRKLLALLRQADLVKFAEIVPTPAGKEQDVQQGLSYIYDTGPVSEDQERPDIPGQLSGGRL
ncbi:MAG: hypothetical protein Q8P24_14355 [Desulfobacterales bacterium]|nr:hypothetical protein [Desulfobacterales bacterium]